MGLSPRIDGFNSSASASSGVGGDGGERHDDAKIMLESDDRLRFVLNPIGRVTPGSCFDGYDAPPQRTPLNPAQFLDVLAKWAVWKRPHFDEVESAAH